MADVAPPDAHIVAMVFFIVPPQGQIVHEGEEPTRVQEEQLEVRPHPRCNDEECIVNL